MKQGLNWRIALSLLVLIAATVYILPCLPGVSQSAFARFLPDSRINLGLDLKGGMHLTLGVDVDKAIDNSLTQNGRDIISLARQNKIVVQKPKLLPGNKLEFILLQAQQKDELAAMMAKNFSHLQILSVQSGDDGKSLRHTVSFTAADRRRLEDMALDQALKTIRSRIDQFGVSEPDIRKFEDAQRIQIQLPGLEDPARAIELIGKTAHLEFRLVRDDIDVERAKAGMLPSTTELLPNVERSEKGGQPTYLVVDKEALLTGESVADAQPGYDPRTSEPEVNMSFDSRGAALFERITGEYKGKRLAIVLDGRIYSAPVIKGQIAGGKASISGSFTPAEANDLALVLRAGSLPAPVTVLEERNVGPSLGQDSIDNGIRATVFGALLVLVFMGIYYRWSGMIANLMLAFDMILLMAGMALFGATLTLPGIAGIVLTLGMAVDANVLIFERIREELLKGANSLDAVKEGFGKATVTILDSNLTTIIAALVLYQFGTGPIRGFAVTLCLGVLASMFTAVFVAHVCFDLWMGQNGKKISI